MAQDTLLEFSIPQGIQELRGNSLIDIKESSLNILYIIISVIQVPKKHSQ